jgi:hypothetical protein
MLSRRELIAAGVSGGLASTPTSVHTTPAVVEQPADREGQKEIARQLESVDSTLRNAFLTSSVAHGTIVRLRNDMEMFLRGNNKFPDYVEVGVAIFWEIYDWHVRYRQEITVTRDVAGRYALRFMFTQLILRPDQDRNYLGVPTDRI